MGVVDDKRFDMPDILTQSESGLARLTLNRPKALHALNTHMCANMSQALLTWRDDPSIRAVLIDHAEGTRGFCAGGDIRMLAESGANDGAEARRFFHAEYRLNYLLFTYPKPIIALMDGVTMGGGVGIALPARFRIATENTSFAMPETGIGLFPDVGGGWHLPRLSGHIGLWLALTGARLKAADCIAAGLASHFVPADQLGEMRARLAPPLPTSESERSAHALDIIGADAGSPLQLTPENRERIDRLFAGESVEAIFTALAADGSDWAKQQLEILQAKSPQTLKVAFRQLREGADASSFAEEMAREYRIAARVVMRHDFREGVRALIIDKDNKPKWDPPTLDGVTDSMLDEIFAPLPPEQEWREWTPLN
jgi:enoyl-CoA hydratase